MDWGLLLLLLEAVYSWRVVQFNGD